MTTKNFATVRWRIIVRCLLTMSLLLLISVSSTSLHAQDPPPEMPNPLPGDPTEPEEPEEEDTYAMAYAEDLGISVEEARQRLDIMLEMPALVNEIEENEAAYAAAWIVHQPDLALVVSFTTPDGAEKLADYLDGIEWADIVSAEQSALSHEELRSMQSLLLEAATERPDLAFESGVFFPAGKIHVFTPTPDEVEEFVESVPELQDRLEYIDVIYQEVLSEDASYSPVMYGGTHLTTCTAGFVFKDNDTGKRYISTAGHCGNNQSSVSTNLGTVVHENDYFYDFQAHDIFRARGSGLTNSVILNQSQERRILSAEYTGSLLGEYVCKYGKTTGITCGTITSTTHTPPGKYNAYLKIEPFNPITNLTCQGDSGGPVYKQLLSGELVAVGLVRGAPNADSCPVTQSYFSATPLNYIGSMGDYSVITGPYPPHFYQNVFAANGSCTQYTADVTPTGDFANWQSGSCQTFAPGSGTVTSYTNWVAGDQLHEAIWRGGYGYVRAIPIDNDGTVNWGSAPAWSQCCSGSSVGGQGAYISGDNFYQNVFQSNGTCNAYSDSLDNDGNYYSPWDSAGPCSTYAPGTGTVTSYTNWVVNNILYEAIWRGGYGYIRNVPINDDGTVNWGGAPTWQQCCSGLSVGGQGAYILWHQ